MKTRIALILMVGAAFAGGCKSEKTVAIAPKSQAQPAILDGSLMTPGTPKITPLDKPVTKSGQTIPLEWNMFWGENGHDWTVSLDGIKLSSGKLPLKSPQSQTGRLDVELDQPGSHVIKVTLCNDHGCTDSLPLEITVPAAT